MKEWKQERPDWCKYTDCIFKKRHQDALCGGRLPSPELHEGDFNCYRICIRFSDTELIDIQVNNSDLEYFRSIFDALDGKITSWHSKKLKKGITG